MDSNFIGGTRLPDNWDDLTAREQEDFVRQMLAQLKINAKRNQQANDGNAQ